jgi:hypothetical protein
MSAGLLASAATTRAHSGIHHAAPSVVRLFPEREGPGEAVVFHHSFVTAPGRAHQQIQAASFRLRLSDRGRGFIVVQMVTGDPEEGRSAPPTLWPVATTLYPASANPIATPRPTPRLAPVTNAIRIYAV